MSDFKAKMHQIRLRWGCTQTPNPAGVAPAPADPAVGAYSTPRPISCIWGAYI